MIFSLVSLYRTRKKLGNFIIIKVLDYFRIIPVEMKYVNQYNLKLYNDGAKEKTQPHTIH